MLKVHSHRHIRFVTVEKPTAWVVVAILLETKGQETIAISEPRIVKILPKNKAGIALPGNTQTAPILALPAPVKTADTFVAPVISPYISLIAFNDAGTIPSLSARPPTKN